MAKILFFECWSVSPHIETALEIAKKHLDQGDEVFFHFLGHELQHSKYLSLSPDNISVKLGLCRTPEVRGARFIRHRNLHFFPRVDLPVINIDLPSDGFSSIGELKQYQYKGYEAGLAVLSSVVSDTRCSNPDLLQSKEKIGAMLVAGARIYEFVCSALVKYRADLAYVFNGRFYDSRAVMNAAQVSNTPFLIHERGSCLEKYSVRPFMPHDANKVQDEMISQWEMVKEDKNCIATAKSFFIDRRNGLDQAWKSFTKEQKKGLLPELDRSKKVISYFSSSDDEFVAIGDIYRWDFWPDQFAAVMSLYEICSALPDTMLVIRIHPHVAEKSSYDQHRWASLSALPNVTVIAPTSKVDTYALVEASNVVVTAGSTVGIEAVYWGVPSINLGPSFYSKLDATYQAKGEGHLKALLVSDSLAVVRDRALPYGYYISTYGEKYRYYVPEALFSGRFMGVNLAAPPLAIKILSTVWHGWIKPLKLRVRSLLIRH